MVRVVDNCDDGTHSHYCHWRKRRPIDLANGIVDFVADKIVTVLFGDTSGIIRILTRQIVIALTPAMMTGFFLAFVAGMAYFIFIRNSKSSR